MKNKYYDVCKEQLQIARFSGNAYLKSVKSFCALMFVVFMTGITPLQAQVTVELYNGGSSGNSAVSGPIYQSGQTGNNSRHVYLYTQDELAAAGIFPGSTITSLGWYKANAAVLINNARARMHMFQRSGSTLVEYGSNVPVLEYTDTSAASGNGWEYIGTAEYDTNAANNLPTAINWMEVPVTPFVYTGGGLEIYIHNLLIQDVGNVTSATLSFRRQAGPFTNLYSVNASPTTATTFTRQQYRPDLQVKFNRPANNALVAAFAEPVNFCAGTYDIKIQLQNNGSNIINNVQIHWTMNGVMQPPINWTTPVDIIGSAGGNTAIITLRSGVNFTANTPVTIKAWTMQPNGVSVPVRSTDTLNDYLRPALSGTYTIGGASPDFPLVTDAVNELHKSGVCGPVVFNIRPGTYNGEMQIRKIPNASPVNTVTFRSSTNNASDVIIANPLTGSGNNYVIWLSNTSDIIFRRLTLAQTGTNTLYTTVFSIGDTTDRITIDSCIISAPTSTSNSFGNALIGAKAGNIVSNNYYGSGLVVSNNILRGGGMGIVFQGTGSIILEGSNCVFDNNTIENFGNTGINFQYTRNIKARNNVVKASPATTASSQFGISVSNSYELLEVTGNRIYVPGGTGPTAQANGIYFSTTYSSASKQTIIANNEIVIKGGATATTAMGGIYATTSAFQNIYNNSVNVIGGSAANVYAGYFSYTGSTSNSNVIYNNVFANSSGGRALYVNLAPASNVMDYNNIYTSQPGGELVQKAFTPTGAHNSLASWRTASGIDRNSLSYRPGFVDDTTLRPNPNDTASWSLNGRGIHIPGNVTDINGNPRSVLPLNGVPDIGAYEFTPAVLPPAAIATPTNPVAGTPQTFTFGEDTVAVITWNGATIPASVVVRQYSGTKPPAYTAPDSMYFYTDVAAGAGPYDYNAAVYYKEPWMGSIKIEPGIRLAAQSGSNPWQFYSSAGSSVDTLRNRILKENLTQSGLYTGTGEVCAGQPQATVFVTPDITTPQCPGSVYTLTVRDPDITSGIIYQWQQAPSIAGPWTNVSTGSDPTLLYYTTPPLNDMIYYRVRSTCGNGGSTATSASFGIPIVPSAQMVNVTDGNRCGAGNVTLSAEGSPGSTLYWYSDSTRGTLLDTGSTFETPVITANTNYYVAASSNTKEERLASPEPGTSTVAPSAGQHLKFNVHTIATINTIDIYQRRPSARRVSGVLTMDSVRIFILNLQGDTVGRTPFYSFWGDTLSITREVLPVDITLAPGEYRITIRGTGAQLVRETSSNSFVNLDFPFETPSGAISVYGGGASLTSSSLLLTTYQYLYNWSVSVPCESPRRIARATLGAAPDFEVTPSTIACNDGVATFTVTSPAANFDSVTWTPVAGLFTNAAGTIPYTGGNTATIYARTAVAGQYTYVASAYNTNTDCGNIDTVRNFVQPAQATATANPADICMNGATTLRLDHVPDFGSGSVQWQSSPNGVSYTDISGATSSTYMTGSLNATSYYRAAIRNSAGGNCITVPLTVTVNDNNVVSSNSAIHCGPDSVTLSAVGSPGSVLTWYNVISGGTALDTGTNYTTPFLSNTATFYVAASGGKRSNYFGKQYRTVTGVRDSVGGLNFDAYVPFTIESVSVYPVGTGTGTVTIALLTASGAVLDSAIVTLTGTAHPGIKTVVPLNFSVPAGGNMRLAMRRRSGGVTGLVRENVPTASTEITYPYTLSATASITSAAVGSSVFNKNYPFFFDWKIYQPCESPRTPVIASITPAPAFAASAVPATICIGDTSILTATSGNTGYTYEWTPGPFIGGAVPVSPVNNTVYYVKALDNSGGVNDGCVGYDSVSISINTPPPALLTTVGTTTFCEGDSVLMFANTGAGYSYQWQLNNADIAGAINSTFYAKEDGNYTVAVTDVNACAAISDPEDITVHPAPEPVIVPDGNGLTTSSFESYQWYYDGALISGATGRHHTPQSSGEYTVRVMDIRGCYGMSEPYQYNPTSVNAIQSNRDVRIYPNPASSTVYIESPVPVQVTLSSVDGKEVFHQKGVQQIDISSLSDAVYMIRVADLDGQVLNLSRLVKAAK